MNPVRFFQTKVSYILNHRLPMGEGSGNRQRRDEIWHFIHIDLDPVKFPALNFDLIFSPCRMTPHTLQDVEKVYVSLNAGGIQIVNFYPPLANCRSRKKIGGI